MARGRNNQMQWDNVGGGGLSDAVGNAAVATAGLVEANNGIAGLADRFINLGESISKKATERRNKALDEYTNNLFNEALQEATDSRGLVDMTKLNAGINKRIAAGEANGEFWGREEIGNNISKKVMENLNQIAGNNLHKYGQDLAHNRWASTENRLRYDKALQNHFQLQKEISNFIASAKPDAETVKRLTGLASEVDEYGRLWANSSQEKYAENFNALTDSINNFFSELLVAQQQYQTNKNNIDNANKLYNFVNRQPLFNEGNNGGNNG